MRFYKPNDRGTGAAFQLNIGHKKGGHKNPTIFVEATKQNGPKPPPGSRNSPFDWTKKIVFMFNAIEAAELLLYISGQKDSPNGVNLVHQTEREGQKTISGLSLKRPITEEEMKFGNWLFSIKRDKEIVSCRMSPAEILLIKTMCEQLTILEATHVTNIKNIPEDSDSNFAD